VLTIAPESLSVSAVCGELEYWRVSQRAAAAGTRRGVVTTEAALVQRSLHRPGQRHRLYRDLKPGPRNTGIALSKINVTS